MVGQSGVLAALADESAIDSLHGGRGLRRRVGLRGPLRCGQAANIQAMRAGPSMGSCRSAVSSRSPVVIAMPQSMVYRLFFFMIGFPQAELFHLGTLTAPADSLDMT